MPPTNSRCCSQCSERGTRRNWNASSTRSKPRLPAGAGRDGAGVMASRQKLNQFLLAKALSGKEIARLVLQNYMDEQSGRQPTFSEADLERARATLRGRPEEAAVYNAWIEAARIIDCISLEAIGKALEAEKRLARVIGSLLGLLRHGLLRHARQRATRILTPAEWATFPARQEQARQERMEEEKISFAEVVRGRAWWLAPEEL